MSEPRRWKDSPNAPVGMRELLGAARRTRTLDEATFARGAHRVARLSVVPATVAATSVWAKLAAAGALGVVTIGTVVTLVVSHEEAPGKVPSSVPPAAPAAHSTSGDAAPTPSPTPPSVDEPASLAARPASPPSPPRAKRESVVAAAAPPAESTAWIPEEPKPKSTLSEELALLESARRSLVQHPEAALENLAEHRARFPLGVLASERDLMELDALRRIGREQDARSRARALLDRDPSGMHAERVRQILRLLDE